MSTPRTKLACKAGSFDVSLLTGNPPGLELNERTIGLSQKKLTDFKHGHPKQFPIRRCNN